MRTLLRWLGSVAFGGLSIMLWINAATMTADGEWVLRSGLITFLLGASLASLGVLLLTALSGWGEQLLELARCEVHLTELEIISMQDSGMASVQAFPHQPVSETTFHGVAGSALEEAHRRREWTGARGRNVARVLRT